MKELYMRGTYQKGDQKFVLYAISKGNDIELFITDMYSHVQSAYKTESMDEYSYLTSEAKEVWKFIKTGITRCSNKRVFTAPVAGLGTIKRYTVNKGTSNWSIDKYSGQFVGCEASGVIGKDNVVIYLCYTEPYDTINLNYVKLTNYTNYTIKNVTGSGDSEFANSDSFEETIPVRSLAEISLEKDTTWLNEKHYYIVNDETQAEQIFTYLENYKGIISYDTETTGLCINMFGEIGSERKAMIDAENERLKAEGKSPYKVDRLVGIIFCIERNVSYYFPCFNRKFKNLYSDTSDENTRKVIDRIQARYTIGDLKDSNTSMANYIRNTPKDKWQSDVILMERVRDILEKGWLGTHHGSFEYKVGLMYSIDSNLKDDSMLLHQLLYKFRAITASNDRGEPSNLKYLTKVEFGVDQLDLKDFFVDYSEDSTGLARQSGKKKKGSNIDFSYMDYDGARAYAPADGDFTLGLILKYKAGLMTEEFKKQEYLYTVEVIVSCAIGYMEYYGHRLDEARIEATKINTYTNMLLTEKKIRDLINANTEKESLEFDKLIKLKDKLSELEDKRKNDKSKALLDEYNNVLHDLDNQNLLLREMIDTSENQLNLASPAQVGELFYDRLGIPVGKDGVKSVSKRAIKPLAKAKDENMNLKYPVVKYYMDWKNDSTLLTKFFDNLPNYMYPGGFIFSGYGQITTATGRMSCSKPNAQQYPHSVTCMVIPRDNCVFADADYSQIEYRTLTAMAKETSLMEKFTDPDMDYHTTMASLMYDTPYANVTGQMRSEAKTFNFGIPYGMGLKKLAFQLKGSEDAAAVAEAKEKYELYFKEQPNVRRFFMDVKESARVYNYTETKWGRRRYYCFNDETGKLDTRKMGAALRQAGNAVIQGCLGGDTLIQTKDFGIVKIKDIVGSSLQVWDGDKWSNGLITYSGKKQKCIVHFTNGQSMICSPIHKFLTITSKGNDLFVECKDLRGSINSKNPHRVAINHKYESSDFRYSSDWAYKYSSLVHNSHNVFIDDIGDSFNEGVVLGRIASDGSILNRKQGGSCITHYIAEHEYNILEKLKLYMTNLGCIECNNKVRKNRNEKVDRLYVYSQSLVNEISYLDIKHQIHDNIFKDTELLRGFLRGLFDGDGGISGKTISLVFGKQYDFEPMCLDIQKALLFFGIRSRYKKYKDRYIVKIKTNDNQKFLNIIGFLNDDKQKKGMELKCIRDEHIFGSTLVVESVEITDEYIDMYDVCNTDGGYYVADGIITHNTAADIFKIGVARNFLFIRENKLFGKYFITNMVHDEQLVEISCDLNVQVILANLIKAMELHIKGFPPLYVGAGIGESWDEAKGKMAEIHPILGRQFVKECEESGEGLYADDNTRMTPEQVYEYFKKRNYEFREQKILNYVLDEKNYGETLHPVIGSLLGLQFDYGVKKELKERFPDGQEGITYTKEEKEEAEKASPLERLKRFIEAHNLNISIDNFKSNVVEDSSKEEEEDGYSDGEEDDDVLDLDDDDTGLGSSFKLIDESSENYGCSLIDLVREFGFVISKKKKIVAIYWDKLTYSSQREVQKYLERHMCVEGTKGAYKVLLLNKAGRLKPEPEEPQLYITAVNEEQFMSKINLDN